MGRTYYVVLGLSLPEFQALAGMISAHLLARDHGRWLAALLLVGRLDRTPHGLRLDLVMIFVTLARCDRAGDHSDARKGGEDLLHIHPFSAVES